MKVRKHTGMQCVLLHMLILFMLILVAPVCVWAESEQDQTIAAEDTREVEEKSEEVNKEENAFAIEGVLKKKAAVTGKWKTKNDQFFYYENGKKITGLKKIAGKYYYFDSKGVQRTGWQKYQDAYYFFQIANRKKGFMITSKKVNGITLGNKGKAKLTSASTAKLNVLIKANQIVEKAVKPGLKKSEKLRQLFDYSLQHFKYRGSPTFQLSNDWELKYALQMFDAGHGSCYAYGAAFAFLANAAGFTDCYAISSGGHGWTEVNGKIYDLSWCLTDKNHSYYGVSYDLSGVAGRPNYRRARTYVVKI